MPGRNGPSIREVAPGLSVGEFSVVVGAIPVWWSRSVKPERRI